MSTVNASASLISQVANNAKAALVNTANAAVEKDNMPILILIGVTVLIFLGIILYITFAMKSSKLKGKTILSTPVRVNQIAEPVQVSNGDIPKGAVGREFTYSFWVYMENFEADYDNVKRTPNHKLIFYRGVAGDVASANPVVMMDGQSNRLYIVLKSQGSSYIGYQNRDINQNLDDILTNNVFVGKKPATDATANTGIVLAVDYVPLQRWVHFAVVVDNKLATIYMDGAIYSVKTTDEFVGMQSTPMPNLILDKTDGDIFIGKNTIGGGKTLDGFVSGMKFFNYAITADDVYAAYKEGPINKGMLKALGMGQYGVRSPIYKLNEQVSA